MSNWKSDTVINLELTKDHLFPLYTETQGYDLGIVFSTLNQQHRTNLVPLLERDINYQERKEIVSIVAVTNGWKFKLYTYNKVMEQTRANISYAQYIAKKNLFHPIQFLPEDTTTEYQLNNLVHLYFAVRAVVSVMEKTIGMLTAVMNRDPMQQVNVAPTPNSQYVPATIVNFTLEKQLYFNNYQTVAYGNTSILSFQTELQNDIEKYIVKLVHKEEVQSSMMALSILPSKTIHMDVVSTSKNTRTDSIF